METKELIKAALLLFFYLLVAPALGFLLRRKPGLQRVAFFVMCFMTIRGFFSAAEWGLTLGFDPDYRGHARGFHFLFNEGIAIALIMAAAAKRRADFRFVPPGLVLYFLYCGMAFISIINAPGKSYVFMVTFLALKAALFFVAAYNFIKTEEDIRFFLFTMCVTIGWEGFVVVKMKYLDGRHQVQGTFEHQNALCMYANMIAMPLLAVGAGPKGRWTNLCLMMYFVCAVIVVFTLSRAGLVIFGIGTVAVLLLGLLIKMTRRRFLVIAIVTLATGLGLLKTMDTIIARFNDKYTRDSKETRVMLRTASLMMLRDHALGVGWNNYGITINHPYPYGDHIDAYFLKHGERTDKKARKGIEESHYFLILAETGYQGLIFYLIMVGVFLYWNVRGAWFFRQGFLGAVSLGVATGCGINYLQSFFERVLTQPRNFMLWMILLAITAKIESWRRIALRQGYRPDRADKSVRAKAAGGQPARAYAAP